MSDPTGLALYVHWPFCQAKCPYCDFNSHVVTKVDHARWRRAMEAELRRSAQELPDRILTSIFFGGGTPSLMEPETVALVMEAARSLWPSANDLEVTLEANPTSAEATKFTAFKDAGVNRVSVGLQALNDADLKALGRLHTAEEGIAAFRMAREIFDRCSFDLIYARQNQSLAQWQEELMRALELKPDHMSLYQLTIEEGTAFGDRFARGLLRGLPGEDLAADMYELTQEICEGAGLPAYETSNHAKPGAESRHNLTYWRSGDWIGVGPGAHGRFTKDGQRIATEAYRLPLEWLASVEGGSGESLRSTSSSEETFDEILLMGLRLNEGIPAAKVSISPDKLNYINTLTDKPLLKMGEGYLRLTKAGRPLLNSVLKELLA